jgi:hypothetical protein
LINYVAFGIRGFLTAGTFIATTLGGFSALGFAGALGFASATGVATIASIPIGIGTSTWGDTIVSTIGANSTLYGASTGAGVEDPKPNNALILFNIIMSPYEFIYIN